MPSLIDLAGEVRLCSAAPLQPPVLISQSCQWDNLKVWSSFFTSGGILLKPSQHLLLAWIGNQIIALNANSCPASKRSYNVIWIHFSGGHFQNKGVELTFPEQLVSGIQIQEASDFLPPCIYSHSKTPSALTLPHRTQSIAFAVHLQMSNVDKQHTKHPSGTGSLFPIILWVNQQKSSCRASRRKSST